MPRTRQPKAPAPAAGPPPSAAGATAPTPPVRVASGQPHGERQASTQQQQGAPLAVAPQHQSAPQPQPGGGPPPAQPNIDPASLFAPTEQPNMPIVGGRPAPKIIPDDPYMLVRQIWSVFPNPDIARLMRGIPDI